MDTTPAPWRPIPRRILSRGGPGQRDGVLIAQLVAGVAIAGSIAWLAWSLLRPLPQPSPAPLRPLAELPSLKQPTPNLESRRTTVAALSTENIFAHTRRLWGDQPIADIAATTEPTPKPDAPESPAKQREKPQRGKELPDDIRKSLEGLALKQIYTQRNGELIARISLVKSPDPENTIPLRLNEEFKDAPNAPGSWKLVSIDRVTNRVILERSGHRVSLSVFSAEPLDEADTKPQAAASTESPPPATVPDVLTRSRDEIITELHAANVADADIAALVELLDRHPELVEAPPASSPAVQPAAGASGRAPPPGLEGVLRMMGQQQKKAAGAGPAASSTGSK